MDNKRSLIEKLVPLYLHGGKILIGLKEDYFEDTVTDGLYIEVDLETQNITGIPWSGQKMMKYNGAYVVAIDKSERGNYLHIIENKLDHTTVRKIVDLLQYPPAESVQSLIWKPERLRK